MSIIFNYEIFLSDAEVHPGEVEVILGRIVLLAE